MAHLRNFWRTSHRLIENHYGPFIIFFLPKLASYWPIECHHPSLQCRTPTHCAKRFRLKENGLELWIADFGMEVSNRAGLICHAKEHSHQLRKKLSVYFKIKTYIFFKANHFLKHPYFIIYFLLYFIKIYFFKIVCLFLHTTITIRYFLSHTKMQINNKKIILHKLQWLIYFFHKYCSKTLFCIINS